MSDFYIIGESISWITRIFNCQNDTENNNQGK